MNKFIVFMFASLLLAAGSSFAASSVNPCQAVAAGFADKELHSMYPGKQYTKEEVSLGDVTLSEEKSGGFQVWSVGYGINEECLDGFNMLLRASQDGSSCAFIKSMDTGYGRDCG